MALALARCDTAHVPTVPARKNVVGVWHCSKANAEQWSCACAVQSLAGSCCRVPCASSVWHPSHGLHMRLTCSTIKDASLAPHLLLLSTWHTHNDDDSLLSTVPCLPAACPQIPDGYTFTWGVDHFGDDIACSSANRTIAAVAANCAALPQCAGFNQFTSSIGENYDCIKTNVSAPVRLSLMYNTCHGTFTKGGDALAGTRAHRTCTRKAYSACRGAPVVVLASRAYAYMGV